MNIDVSEAGFERLMRELGARVPFLKVISLRQASDKDGDGPDWMMEVEVVTGKWIWAIEVKERGQPREVRNGLLRLRNCLAHTRRKNTYGVLIAPFLSKESARLCIDAGMGYADLAGNARLCFDGVFIELLAADNSFQAKRQLRSLFGSKAGRVLRLLLTPPLREWKVAELADASRISLGHVSNVRNLLLEHEWAVVGENGLRLSKPEELARNWQATYEVRPRSRKTFYTLLHGKALETAMQAALADAGSGENAVLASYSAAQWLAPYARQATLFLYANENGAAFLTRRLQLQPVDRGENVVLLDPKEDDVFTGRLEAAPGIWCSGLIQTWLDLSVGGERGLEAADHLLRERVLPSWRDSE